MSGGIEKRKREIKIWRWKTNKDEKHLTVHIIINPRCFVSAGGNKKRKLSKKRKIKKAFYIPPSPHHKDLQVGQCLLHLLPQHGHLPRVPAAFISRCVFNKWGLILQWWVLSVFRIDLHRVKIQPLFDGVKFTRAGLGSEFRGQVTLRGQDTLEWSDLHDLLCSYGANDRLHGADVASIWESKTFKKSIIKLKFLLLSFL